MLSPLKVIQLDLNQPLSDLTGLEGYVGILALVQLHGQVLGYGKLPIIDGGCDRLTMEAVLHQQLGPQICQTLWINGLLHGLPGPKPTFADLRSLAPLEPAQSPVPAETPILETSHPENPNLDSPNPDFSSPASASKIEPGAIAIRSIELKGQPLTAIEELDDFATTRIFIESQGRLWGFIDIENNYQAITAQTLAQAIGDKFASASISSASIAAHGLDWWDSQAIPQELTLSPPETARLSTDISVAIIVGTCDRPDDLRHCLAGLTAQNTERALEIIVVDNRPASGLTPPVVAEFSDSPYPVQWLSESRPGVAYARNAGILAARSEIIVTVDDDVTLPQDWLEKLIAPFTQRDVVGVTGNVLPLELNTRSQRLFEDYGEGGLGRGFRRFTVDSAWFEQSRFQAVPTWKLGGTANSAYRASLFQQAEVGLMDEALGPGMPSGVGEDIHLFYRILKSGKAMVYQADAYLWHRHRRDLVALKKQLYNYSKGFIGYQLTTLEKDRDYRALTTLLLVLPLYNLKRLIRWLLGDRHYPLGLIVVEIMGSLAGPWSLWRSRQRVRVWGPSLPPAVSPDGPSPPAPSGRSSESV